MAQSSISRVRTARGYQKLRNGHSKKHSKGVVVVGCQSARWTDDEATTLERVSCVSSSASREQLLGGQSTRPSPHTSQLGPTPQSNQYLEDHLDLFGHPGE